MTPSLRLFLPWCVVPLRVVRVHSECVFCFSPPPGTSAAIVRPENRSLEQQQQHPPRQLQQTRLATRWLRRATFAVLLGTVWLRQASFAFPAGSCLSLMVYCCVLHDVMM